MARSTCAREVNIPFSGKKLGRYEILTQLGAGGMGEVYLAQDTKLDRKVALKILPAELASNRDRMERFIREAKSAAALNHPHIAHVYEIDIIEGQHFIAMEYIDGVTLREKMHHEHAELGRLLRYLQHVAEGLAKAHAAGIVHRDLKPDNIMITREGHAKILDFGLAKLVERRGIANISAEPVSEQATAALPMHSIPGTVLGTLGYMSPEQALGKTDEIDQRSDVFSLGCMLYEAATRRKAFKGTDTLDSLHKIVHAPTPLIKEANSEAPDELQRIVRRCLAKDPDDRYQSIKDVAIELRDLRRELGIDAGIDTTVVPTFATGQSSAGVFTQSASLTREVSAARQTSSAEYVVAEIKRHKRGVIAALTVIVLAAAGIFFGSRLLFEGSKRVVPFQSITITRLTGSGKVINAIISPDGKYIGYTLSDAGQQSIWVRQTTSTKDINVIPAAPVEFWGMTFSQDSNDLFYVVREKDRPGVLYRMPALGGVSRKLITRVDGPVTVSPDGQKIAFIRGNFPGTGESALMAANADGTGEQILAKRKLPELFYPIAYTGPSWSPDGELVASSLRSHGAHGDVIAVKVKDGMEQKLTRQDWFLISRVEWLSDGTGLLMIASNQASSPTQIWHLSYPGGEARRITNDLKQYRTLSVTSDFRKLAAVQVGTSANVWFMPEGVASRGRQIMSSNDEGWAGLSWTPDGKIIFASGGNDTPFDLWLMDPETGSRKQLTNNAASNIFPSVSSDARYVVFVSNRGGSWTIWRMDLDGSNPQQLTSGIGDGEPTFSSDGKWVVYSSLTSGLPNLWKVPIDGGNPMKITDKFCLAPSVSPDGKLIACTYLENPNTPDALPDKIAIIPFEGGAPLKTFDIHNNGTNPMIVRWSADGRSLFYNETRNNISNLWSQPLDGGAAKQITEFRDSLMASFAWSPDGKQLAASRGNRIRDAVLISDAR